MRLPRIGLHTHINLISFLTLTYDVNITRYKKEKAMNVAEFSGEGSPKSKMIYHEDMTKFHVGTMANHAYFIPFAKEQDPFLPRERSERFFLLNGDWRFRYYASIMDMEDDFLQSKYWDRIPVPANWQLHGYDKAQ